MEIFDEGVLDFLSACVFLFFVGTQPWQQTQPQQHVQNAMPVQAQGGWGGPQPQQGQPLQQPGMQQAGMYGQAQGAQYAGQQGQYGYPQQQQPQMQMQMQPQQQQMYQQQFQVRILFVVPVSNP